MSPLFNKDNELENDPKKMADLLQEQYLSVFSNPTSNQKELPDFQLPLKSLLDEKQFSEMDIIKAIDEICIDCACGEDDIPAIVLKNCKKSLSYPLLKLWKDSFENGYIPTQYKCQIIIAARLGFQFFLTCQKCRFF